jgi:hypothetical protein
MVQLLQTKHSFEQKLDATLAGTAEQGEDWKIQEKHAKLLMLTFITILIVIYYIY